MVGIGSFIVAFTYGYAILESAFAILGFSMFSAVSAWYCHRKVQPWIRSAIAENRLEDMHGRKGSPIGLVKLMSPSLFVIVYLSFVFLINEFIPALAEILFIIFSPLEYLFNLISPILTNWQVLLLERGYADRAGVLRHAGLVGWVVVFFNFLYIALARGPEYMVRAYYLFITRNRSKIHVILIASSAFLMFGLVILMTAYSLENIDFSPTAKIVSNRIYYSDLNAIFYISFMPVMFFVGMLLCFLMMTMGVIWWDQKRRKNP